MEYEIIKQLVKERRLIPFIGAGFSIPLGLPSWPELIGDLAKDLGWDPEVFIQSGDGNFLQLAEYYCLEKSIGDLRHHIEKRFNISDDEVKASKSHEYLVKMNPKMIYTTNYDEGIETAFKISGKKSYIIKDINDFKNSNSEETVIYKFHGALTNDNSLVLTESSYFDRLAFEDPLDIRLRSDILNNTLLFLGYSLSDINMRYIFYKLANIQKKMKSHANNVSAIMVTFGLSKVQKRVLSAWGIEIIELSPIDKTVSLAEFMQKITD
jgi:hypothetical protein